MGSRPFAGIQALSGTAQPVFGTAITAAVTPPPDQFSGRLTPGSNETQVVVIVASTKGFIPGDRVAVGPTAAFKPGIAAVGSIPDQGQVKSVVDATHLLIQGLKQSHAATGEWVVLNEAAGDLHIRPVVTTASVYIGNSSTVSSTDQSVIDVLPITALGAGPTYTFDTNPIGPSQPVQCSEFWIIGAAADTFVARFTQI